MARFKDELPWEGKKDVVSADSNRNVPESDPGQDLSDSSDETLQGAQVNVHRRPAKKPSGNDIGAPPGLTGDAKIKKTKKKKVAEPTEVFGSRLGSMISTWNKVKIQNDKQAKLNEEESEAMAGMTKKEILKMKAWKLLQDTAATDRNPNFIEIGSDWKQRKRSRLESDE